MTWYYSDGENQLGPVSEEKLIELRRAGSVTVDTLVWREGLANWAPYREVGPVMKPESTLPSSLPPQIPAPPVVQLAAHEAVCAECGKIFPKAEMIAHGHFSICAGCKPVFMQKLAEGARVGIPGTVAAFRYAGFWIRVGARMLDGILLGIVLDVPLLAIILAQGGNMERAFGKPGEFGTIDILMLAWQLAFYVIFAGYEIFFVGKYGATPGKMVCRIQVVTAEGDKIRYPRAVGRFFAYLLSGMICYIGYIIAGFDDQKRALHDHICNTRVIYKD